MRTELGVTHLEDRTTPANLRMIGVQMLDGNNLPLFTTVNGGQIRLQVNYDITDLADTDKYFVRATVNGIDLPSAELKGTGGVQVPQTVALNGWYAKTGVLNTITVSLDSTNSVAETNETDNSKTITFTPIDPNTVPENSNYPGKAVNLPQKFIVPVNGVLGKDFTYLGYNDLDPKGGSLVDSQGGKFAYDNASKMSIGIANYARMDTGISVIAAADGVVESVADGNFDRQTDNKDNAENSVVIKHNDGWKTFYTHLSKTSVTVRAGETVQAGQVIGLLGGSGKSLGAHLEFQATYLNAPVDLVSSTTEFFRDMVPYQGTLVTTILDQGFTNYDPNADFPERPMDALTVGKAAGKDLYFWANLSHTKAGQKATLTYARPDGSTASTSSLTFNSTGPQTTVFDKLAAAKVTVSGTWSAKLEIGGVTVGTQSFTVVDGAGPGNLRISQSADPKLQILPSRTTRIDFGAVAVGATEKAFDFDFTNLGGGAITLSGLKLPDGFSVAGNFPSSIAAGATTKITFQLDSAGPGFKSGDITFSTSDPEVATYRFAIVGEVTGSNSAGRPILNVTPRQTNYRDGTAPEVIAPDITFTDADTSAFVGGNITAKIVSAPIAGDILSIRDEGTGPGQISFSKGDVIYNGEIMGTSVGGTNNAPLVITLNGFATQAATRALMANLTFASTAPVSTARRTVAITLQDTQGTSNVNNTSAAVYRNVVPVTPPDVLSFSLVPPLSKAATDSIIVTFANLPDPATFSLEDITLTKASDKSLVPVNLLTPEITLTAGPGKNEYTIGNLAKIANTDDTYTLTVDSATIRTVAGTAGLGKDSIVWGIDSTAPTVTINQAPTQLDPTTTPPFEYVVVFSEPVTGFDVTDLLITGTAGGKTAEITGSGANYIVRITEADTDGTVIVSIVAGAAIDGAGNPSAASTSTDNEITFNSTPPDNPPTITAISDIIVPFNGNSGPIAFTIGDDKTLPDNLILRASSDNPVLFPNTSLVIFGTGTARNIVVV
ncbi:MAG: peptidoglycan DD-metalloendopeptidase family protein, partial [Gemmataceae bacterium]